MQRAAIFNALIASAFVFPSELLRAIGGETDACPKTGSRCQYFEALCYDPVIGFATCEHGKVRFHSCKDGCGEVNGKIQCVDNPK
jgi:hypothetical protein